MESAANTSATSDEVLEAIDGLVRALRENSARGQKGIRRAEKIRKMRRKGLSYRQILAEGAPLVEVTRQNFENLVEHGSRLRRAEARALHEEGCTMDEIALLFGVTRQRISAILKEARADDRGGYPHESRR